MDKVNLVLTSQLKMISVSKGSFLALNIGCYGHFITTWFSGVAVEL